MTYSTCPTTGKKKERSKRGGREMTPKKKELLEWIQGYSEYFAEYLLGKWDCSFNPECIWSHIHRSVLSIS